jgi:hypothetical protein
MIKALTSPTAVTHHPVSDFSFVGPGDFDTAAWLPPSVPSSSGVERYSFPQDAHTNVHTDGLPVSHPEAMTPVSIALSSAISTPPNAAVGGGFDSFSTGNNPFEWKL